MAARDDLARSRHHRTTQEHRVPSPRVRLALTSSGSRLKARSTRTKQVAVARVTLVDNYDSFTWNLFHEFGALGAEVTVLRNDDATSDEILAAKPDAIVLSPGPCTPREAGVCLDLLRRAGGRMPVLGVCLGHQAIGNAYGGEVVRAMVPMHGKVSTVMHDGRAVFRGIDGAFKATRYHSLVVHEATLPADLEVTARSEDGAIMGLSHRTHPVHGVQFHPESIASENGRVILGNFLDLADAWNRARPH